MIMKKIILFILILTSLQGIGQTKVAAPLVTNSPLDSTYGTHFDSLGYGGYVAFASIANRNAFPSALRKRGMSAGVKDSIGIIWQLQGGILNSNWSRFVLGSAGTGGVTNAYNNIDSSVDNQRVIFKKENGEPADTIIFRFVGGSGGSGGTLSRFGIEDNTGVQERVVQMGNFGLTVKGEDLTGFNGELYVSRFGAGLYSKGEFGGQTSVESLGGYVKIASGSIVGGTDETTADFDPTDILFKTPRFRVNRGGGGFKNVVTSVNGILADSTGNITIAAGAGTTETASNGLTKVGNDIRLGGSLTNITTILANNGPVLLMSGSKNGNDSSLFSVINNGQASAIKGETNSINSAAIFGKSTGLTSVGVTGLATSVDGVGVQGRANGATGIAGQFYSQAGIALQGGMNAATAGVIEPILDLYKGVASPTAGTGLSIDLKISTSTSTRLSNQLISKWTNPTDITRTSEFSITGVDNAVTKTLVQISGAGLVRLTQGAPEYADNAAALTAGLPIGTIYRTGDNLKIVR